MPEHPLASNIRKEIVEDYKSARHSLDERMQRFGWILSSKKAVDQLIAFMERFPRSFVLSREDSSPGFWTNKDQSARLLEQLNANPQIVQTRVRVVGDGTMLSEDALGTLVKFALHQGGGHNLRRVHADILEDPENHFPNLALAKYGLTIFFNEAEKVSLFVAVPVPALTLYNLTTDPRGHTGREHIDFNPLRLLSTAGAYDPRYDMQMVIIFEQDRVKEIFEEFTRLCSFEHCKAWP